MPTQRLRGLVWLTDATFVRKTDGHASTVKSHAFNRAKRAERT